MSSTALLLLFGGLCTAALASVWRDEKLIALGGAVVLEFLLSNVVMWAFLHGHLAFEERVVSSVAVDALIASLAFLAWMLGAGRWCMAVLVGITVFSVCAHVGVLFIDAPTKAQRNDWTLLVNLCYATKCVLITTIGLLNRARESYRDRRPSRARLFVARDAYRGEPE